MDFGTPKETIVIGLGNPLMADEGIGTVLADKLAKLAVAGELPSENVEYLDGGCGGMYLLHSIAGRKKVIMIDCALMGHEPGTIVRFTPEDVKTVKKMAHLSLHEVDILKVIELAGDLGQSPEEIVIFGIEPVSITQQMHLNEPIQQRLDEYLAMLKEEILNNE